MTKKFYSTKNTDMTENELMQFTGAFYEEVASNVYLVKKSRLNNVNVKYVDGATVTQELNRSDSRVAVKTMEGKLLLNFSRMMYKKYYEESLNREL